MNQNNENIGKFIEDRDEFDEEFKRQSSKETFSFRPSNNESIEIMDEEFEIDNNANNLNDKKKDSNSKNSEGSEEHHIKIIKKPKIKKK